MPLLLEGADIIYGVGATDAGATISYSQMVLDDELIAGLRRMMQGISPHDLVEEVALIKENTPRGNFLKARHTRQNFRRHWQPGILNRDAYETWQARGGTVAQACSQRARDILAGHRPPTLPDGVEAELERILRRHLGADLRVDTEVRLGVPHAEIVSLAAERKVELLVMATHGRGPISHAFMGSTTERVLRRAPCPVLVIRVGGREENTG